MNVLNILKNQNKNKTMKNRNILIFYPKSQNLLKKL